MDSFESHRLRVWVHQLEGRKKSVERVKSFVLLRSWSVLVERDLPWVSDNVDCFKASITATSNTKAKVPNVRLQLVEIHQTF
jgi:hypothetical protein